VIQRFTPNEVYVIDDVSLLSYSWLHVTVYKLQSRRTRKLGPASTIRVVSTHYHTIMFKKISSFGLELCEKKHSGVTPPQVKIANNQHCCSWDAYRLATHKPIRLPACLFIFLLFWLYYLLTLHANVKYYFVSLNENLIGLLNRHITQTSVKQQIKI